MTVVYLSQVVVTPLYLLHWHKQERGDRAECIKGWILFSKYHPFPVYWTITFEFMNKILAEIRIDNIFTSNIFISKLPREQIRKQSFDNDMSDTMFRQRFAWYQDFIAFYMLRDYQSYWVKIAISESLELDYFIANAKKLRRDIPANVILLPFQTAESEKVYVFGDDDITASFSFTLPTGHYQLLFQNREFTREEIEASPNNDCQDLDYDDWDDEVELCLLTFIPTEKVIKPIILNQSSTRKEKSSPLVLFDRKLNDGN